MKKISFVVPPVFQGNRIFDPGDMTVNRDDCMAAMVTLKEKLKSHGIDISTQDINPIEQSDLVIFENMPSRKDKHFIAAMNHKKKMFLKITEWGALNHGNADMERHKDFSKIFTYEDDPLQ